VPKVKLTASGKGVGATGEGEAFTEMVRVEIAGVAALARPEIRVGAEDDVTVTVVVDRRDQAAVGSILERLLQDVDISSTVIDEGRDQFDEPETVVGKGGDMATVMLLHWRDASKELYEQVRGRADWEGDRPQGVQLHVVGWSDDGMHILDIWDSPEDFQAFFESRVLPVVKEAGIASEPDVKMFDLHGIYAPGFGKTEQTASV
jgi:hypothetical protein